jgi:hypothetical protein
VGTDAKKTIRVVAGRQHGAIALRQLQEAGLSRQQIRTMIASGELSRAGSKVFVVSGSPASWLRDAMAATLVQHDLWLSHRAAAHLHGFDGFSTPPAVELVGPRGRRPALPSGAIHHVSDLLAEADVCHKRAIPTTNSAATLCQLPAVVSLARVEQALDHVLRMGASPLWIRRTATRLARSRARGPQMVLRLLDDRVGRRLPRSWFERLAHAAFEGHGIVLEHEYPVVDAGRVVASLDLAEPALRVGVECQSNQHHGSPADAYRDARRRRLLRRLGWQVVEVWWWDLERMAEVVDEVLAALQVAQKRLESNHFCDTSAAPAQSWSC